MAETAGIPGVSAVTLYEPAVCRSFIECAGQTGGWIDARVDGDSSGSHDPGRIDSEVRNAEVLPLWNAPGIAHAFDVSVRQIVLPLAYQRWDVHLPKYADAQIVRYRPGGHYIAHLDRGPEAETRYFTLLCYLNDDFSGGATRFPDFDHSETPRCGRGILFPAEYRHSAEPVLDGCKYIMVAWLVGPPPPRWI